MIADRATVRQFHACAYEWQRLHRLCTIAVLFGPAAFTYATAQGISQGLRPASPAPAPTRTRGKRASRG